MTLLRLDGDDDNGEDGVLLLLLSCCSMMVGKSHGLRDWAEQVRGDMTG